MSGGKFRELLDTLGQLIILSVLWMLLTVPLLTAVPATAALYYSVMKAIRKELGDPVKEFFHCFKRTWKKGMLHSLLAAALMGALILGALTVSPAYWIGAAAAGVMLLYLGPVLSRFELKFWELWGLAFLIGFRSIHWTVLIAAGAAAAALAQFYLIPMAALLILPGAMCLAATFPVEKAMGRVMGPGSKETHFDTRYDE